MLFRTAAILGVFSVLSFTHLLANNSAAFQVTDLRCEYLTNPQGIDVAKPRLSWQLASNDASVRGLRQTAYQVLVACDAKRLDADHGDLWDSGKVASDQSVQIVYQGYPLTRGVRAFWKVRTWDADGRVSAWSQPAQWSMGLLKPSDWRAQWIGVAPAAKPTRNDPWFRKTFSLAAVPQSATVYVASVGFHELYINGKKADSRILSPSISDLTQHVRYVTYDVLPYLHEGNNAIAVWAAAGWSEFPEFHVKNKPLVRVQLDCMQPDETWVELMTDATWKTHPSPMSPLGPWRQGNYGGERYDANGEIPGWNTAEFDDSHWDNAVVFSPKLRLSAEMIEPNRFIDTVKPVEITSPAPGVFRVDLGRSFAGWFEIAMKGRPGQKATLEFSERPGDRQSFGQVYEYIFNQSGEGTFCNRFNYAAARWVTIRGLTAAPRLEDVRGHAISTDYRRTGRFECSNPLLNRIYETTLATYRSLSISGYTVDCPHRERCGYGGDAHATMETAMTNFGVGAFYTKWLGDWRNVQRPSGDLPYTAPTYCGGGGPAWSGICITLPWQVYLHFGDRRVLDENYPMMKRWLAFLNTKAKSHLLQPWGGIWDFLGDWVPPGKGQEPGERVDDRSTLLFNNCYYLDNMATAAKIAKLLGHDDDAAQFQTEAAAIAKAIHTKFFNPSNNTYAGGEQLYEAMPLLTGAVPAELQPAVLKRLDEEIAVRKQGHLDTGIHGTYYLLKSLLEQNRNDLIYQMVDQKTYPGWGYMIEQGATTIWEQWDGKNSLLHSSFLSVGSWFIEGLAGIRIDPLQPGYKHFFIRPGVVGDLTWANGELATQYGVIRSGWKLADGWLTLSIDVPANTTATVFMPTKEPAGVTETGQPLAQSSGVSNIETKDGTVVFSIGAGRYVFKAKQ